jgi:mono/diheme cytochrome c family protein
MSEKILGPNGEPQPRREAEAEENRTPDVLAMHHAVMRELDEPIDGLAPTPVTLILLFFAFVGWGGWYISTYSAGFRADGYDEKSGSGPVVKEKKVEDPMVLGKRVYNNCVQCHQADAQGLAGVYPPLAGSEFVNGDAQLLARIVLGGLTGELVVRGQKYNGSMPSWSNLRDEQIAGVLTYVRSSFGNSAPPVDAATIAAVRQATSARTQPWTEHELKTLAAGK